MSLGERLQESRERAGLIQKEVSGALGVPRELISMWENGARIPGLRQIEELARIYQVSIPYLLGEERTGEQRERELMYRGIPQEGKARLELGRWMDFLEKWAELLEDLGDKLPGRGRPPKGLREEGEVTDARRASTLAAGVRKHYGLGEDAIPDLRAFLDEQGFLVYRAPLGSIRGEVNGASGAFYNHPSLGYCILVNAETTPGRQTFTMAHELAHALYHYPSGGLVSIKSDHSPRERFANAFAAHFLVPSGQLKKLSEEERQKGGPDPYQALQLAAYFRVSYATLLLRLQEERIISREYREKLTGYSPGRMAEHIGLDPGDFSIPARQALSLERYPLSVIERTMAAVEDDDLTPSQAAGILDVDVYTLQSTLKDLSNPPGATDEDLREYEELPF